MQLMQSKKIITFHKPLPPTTGNVEINVVILENLLKNNG